MASKKKKLNNGSAETTSKKDVLLDTKELNKEDFHPYLDLVKKQCAVCKTPKDLLMKSYNIKRHFETCHQDVIAILLVDHEAKKAAKAKSKITNYLERSHPAYDELVNLFSSAPLAMSLMDNEHLQKLLSYIPNFKPPKLQKLRSLMVDRLDALFKYVKENCHGSYFAVGTDCGTTKGMLYSYLAVSIHFIDKERKVLTCASFELKELKGRHTADFLRTTLEKALTDAGLNVNFISKTVADGAKNMVNAFFEPFKVTKDENGTETIEEIQDDEHKKLLDAYEKFLLADISVEEFEFLMEDFEDILSPGNLHCAAHRIQLVFKDVFEVDELRAVRKAVFETINHFARSHLASAELYERSKKRLLFPAVTRWGTLTTTYERVLELKDHVNIIAFENGWPVLTKSTLIAIENIVLLTRDLTAFTTTIQSDSRPTISLLYPGLHNVQTNLQKRKKDVKIHPSIDFEDVIDDLIAAIDKRFNDVLTTTDEDGDPLFAAATLMDSSTSGLFPNREYLSLKQTKRIFYAMSRLLDIEDDENDEPDAELSLQLTKNPLGFAIEQPTSQKATPKKKSLGDEVKEFYETITEGNWNFDNPIAAWFIHQKQFPKLFVIAMAILVIPATSAAVERIFSQLKIHTDGHKNRSKAMLTRLRVLLSCNKNLYAKLVVEKLL